MPHTIGGDLIRLLAHEAVSTGGNILTHAITAPMLANQQMKKQEQVENYKTLMNSAALAINPEELAGY